MITLAVSHSLCSGPPQYLIHSYIIILLYEVYRHQILSNSVACCKMAFRDVRLVGIFFQMLLMCLCLAHMELCIYQAQLEVLRPF